MTEIGETESKKGNYADYIVPGYKYSREYMDVTRYHKRISSFALRGLTMGITTCRYAYANKDTLSRHKPGTEKNKVPRTQVMDDETTLRFCIDYSLGNHSSARKRRLEYFEARWKVWVDEFLDTKPTAKHLIKKFDKKTSQIDMDEFIPMYRVMEDRDLMWTMCGYFTQYVSKRMTAYLNENCPSQTMVGSRPIKFWYSTRFAELGVKNYKTNPKYKSRKKPNADNR